MSDSTTCMGRLLIAALLASLPACRDKNEPAPAPSATRPISERARPAADVVPTKLAPPLQRDFDKTGRIGLPAGCRLTLPMRMLKFPSGTLRFVAGNIGSKPTLAAALDTDSDGRVDEAGVVRLSGGPTLPLPWQELEAPPPFAVSDGGWLAVLTEPLGNKNRRAVVWRSGQSVALGVGDHLEPIEARCKSNQCAVLTTVATRTGGSGATVFTTSDVVRSPWRQVDVRPQSAGVWAPYAIASMEEGPRVALVSSSAIEYFQVEKEPRRLDHLSIEGDLHLALYADEPVALVASKAPTSCHEGLRLSVLRRTARTEVLLPGAPEGLIARPLGSGFLLAWVGSHSCNRTDQPMVRALLLDHQGQPHGSPMAVAEAGGFALTTRGTSLDLFLSSEDGVLWVRGQCEPSSIAGP